MFNSVVRYLGFLKHIPGFALVFDALLNLWTLITAPHVLDGMDHIEQNVLNWKNTTATLHKYGGRQFNYGDKELGHIHGNGLVDILLTRRLKERLMQDDERIKDHHLFKKSGWISFYIDTPGDVKLAIRTLRAAYQLHADKK